MVEPPRGPIKEGGRDEEDAADPVVLVAVFPTPPTGGCNCFLNVLVVLLVLLLVDPLSCRGGGRLFRVVGRLEKDSC